MILFRYTKYLYPYECLKRNLSNPNELQAAIEGNKREGRRGSYGAYPEMGMSGLHPGPGMPSQISPMSLVTGPRFNGNGTSHGMPPSKNIIFAVDHQACGNGLLVRGCSQEKPNFGRIIAFDVSAPQPADELMWEFGQLIILGLAALLRVIQIFFSSQRGIFYVAVALIRHVFSIYFESVSLLFIACRST